MTKLIVAFHNFANAPKKADEFKCIHNRLQGTYIHAAISMLEISTFRDTNFKVIVRPFVSGCD